MDVRVGTIEKVEQRRIDAFELWCWRRLLRVPWTPRRSALNIHWKNWFWSWKSNTLATWCEELTHWERSWCCERLKAEEGDNRGWDGWMVSPTQWTWVWVNSGSWQWTGRHGMLLSATVQPQRDQEYPRDWWCWRGRRQRDTHTQTLHRRGSFF